MENFDNICKGCMKDIDGKEICPFCGYKQSEEQETPYLKKGEILEQRYLVGKVICTNSEGIGYIAYDNVLKSPVYIKEFFPESLCYRASNGCEVTVKSGFENQFKTCMNSFLTYLRAVARLRTLSALIPVYNIFTENLTAYAVYEWVEGTKFTDFLKKNDNYISWDVARTLFMPLLSSLSEMNSVGIQHLGVCPENIIVTKESKLKLLGFSIPETRKVGAPIPPTLYDGFSAIEQYIPNYQTNESTDVYSFAATLFFSLTGSAPQKSLKRRTDDRIFIPTHLLKEIPRNIISALANALQVFPEDRIQTFEKLREELSTSRLIVNNNEIYNTRSNIEEKTKEAPKKSYLIFVIISGIISIILLAGIGLFWLLGSNLNNKFSQDQNHLESQFSQPSASSLLPSQTKVQVPDLVGKDYKTIKSKPSSEYQVLLSSEEFSESVNEGIIISQVPGASEQMDQGSAILVTVSKGKKMRKLPEITGLTISDASQRVTSAGFVPIQKQEYSDTVPSGSVIGYDGHNAEDMAEYGSEISILVSKGKQA